MRWIISRLQIISLCNQDPDFNVDGYGFEIHEMSEMGSANFGQIAISNQPSFHLPYLFSYIRKPEYTQQLLKHLLFQNFSDDFYAYPGDEDNGSMSAWYVFNCLGFYPVTPGSGEYVIGMPMLDNVDIQLENGNKISLSTNRNYPQHQFIDEIRLNSKPYSKLYVTHESLMTGPTIEFNLGIVPREREYSNDDLPFSLTKKFS